MARAALWLCLSSALWAASACRTPKITEGGSTLSMSEVGQSDGGATARGSTLGPGDLVEIRVFQEPDLSGPYRLSPEGLIDYPLCGKVSLAGATSSTASDAISRCLANGYLKRPQVSVVVREYNSKKIFVFGEVQKPGTFPFEDNMTIIQALTLAGGFTKFAAKNSTNVTRIIDGVEKKIRVPVADIGLAQEKNFALQPGDIVFVPESFF